MAVSSKLIIVVAVQSALVLGLLGTAIGVSMGSKASASAPRSRPHAKKKPAAEEADAAEPAADEDPAADEPKGHAVHAEAPKKKKGPSAETDHGGHEAAPPKEAAHEEPGVETSAPAATAMNPLAVVAWLDDGNARWAAGVTRTRDVMLQRAEEARRFAPRAMVVTCADGRGAPELVFDVSPGSLMALRAPTLAFNGATMSGVDQLLRRHEVGVLVVMGHDGCGDGSKGSTDEQVSHATAKLLAHQAIRQRVKAGRLVVLRATYPLDTGRVRWLDSSDSPEKGHEPTAAAGPAAHH